MKWVVLTGCAKGSLRRRALRGEGALGFVAALMTVMAGGQKAQATPNVGITTETLNQQFSTAVASGSYAHTVKAGVEPGPGGHGRDHQRHRVHSVRAVGSGHHGIRQRAGDVLPGGEPGDDGHEPQARDLHVADADAAAAVTVKSTVTFSGGTDTFTSSATTFTGVSGFRAPTASAAAARRSAPGRPAQRAGPATTPARSTRPPRPTTWCSIWWGRASRLDNAESARTRPARARRSTTIRHLEHEQQPPAHRDQHRDRDRVEHDDDLDLRQRHRRRNGGGQVALPMIPASTVTAARLGARAAVRYGAAATRISWQTEEEASHLGFQVWRERRGVRTRVGRGLIPGSTFATGAHPLAGRRGYEAWDDGGQAGDRYWLEEVAAHAPSRWHGPMVPSSAAESAGRRLRREGALPAATFAAPPDATPQAPVVPRPALPELTPASACANPAAWGPAVKIAVSATGWIHVDAAALVAAGLPAGTDPSSLALWADGQPVGLRALGGARLDAIEFYGRGTDTHDTGTRIYWLVAGAVHGRAIPVGPSASADSAAAVAGSSVAEVTLRDRSLYVAALLNGRADNFFGAVLSTSPVTQVVTVPDPLPGQPAVAGRRVAGGDRGRARGRRHAERDGAGHRVVERRCAVRAGAGASPGPPGRRVQHRRLDAGRGQRRGRGGSPDRPLPAPVSGCRRPTGGDRVRRRAPHTRLGSAGPMSARSTSPDPDAPIELPGAPVSAPDGYGLVVQLPADGAARIVRAQSSAGLAAPDAVTANIPSGICQAAGAEVAVIAPRAFFPALAPWVAARQAAGWSVELDDVEDVFDEMTFGAHRAAAITDFVRLRRGGANAAHALPAAGGQRQPGSAQFSGEERRGPGPDGAHRH